MFLHIGGSLVIPSRNVVAIFDIDRTTVSKITREYLKKAEKKGCVVSVNDDIPKSFVLADEKKKKTIYLSPISSVTLQKRARYIEELSKLYNRRKI